MERKYATPGNKRTGLYVHVFFEIVFRN